MVSYDRSLVQAAELWFPQGEFLALGTGAYRGNHRLAAGSKSWHFPYGEGLPGAAWASGRALLWTKLTGDFARAELAAEVGINAALGVPLFDVDRLVAVVTLLLSQRTEVPSCLEVWNVDDEVDVLRFGYGYYAHCAELERFSSFIQFPRGTGLPGLTWLSGGVHVMDDVRRSNAFVRAGLAAQCGLKNGIGIPLYRGRKVTQVLSLFGGEQQSFITATELYRPQGTELGAAVAYDWAKPGSPLGQSSADAPGRKLAQEVIASRAPALSPSAQSRGTEISLALPIHDRKGLKDIVVLKF
jgi:hypothetical protein